ncbi:MAG: hypothetical protein NT155_03695 [Candidatus Staskawiczbacteria bacterium]|nr:hypothetical protein [Candidatus Staskawiczbacteria bacterium]
MITAKDFPSLTDDLQSIFNETAKSKVANMQSSKIFNVFDTDRLTYDHLILHGVSGIQRVADGADLPRINSEEGDTVTWTQDYYGAIFGVTKKMRKFDLHDQISQLPKTLVEDAFDKIEQSLADVLLNGFSASNYADVYGASVAAVGPDGLALFSTVHSNNINSNTFSNIITSNPALSRQAVITARTQGRTHKDPNGIKRPINLDTLIVPVALEDLAERILNSDLMPGSSYNDINSLKGKVTTLIVWECLDTRTDGTDTSAYWFMADSSKVGESLQCLFAERPTLDAPDEIYSNKNWDYSCDFYYAIGRGYPAYIFGSNASGS